MATNVTAISAFVRGLSFARPLAIVSVAEFGAVGGTSNEDVQIQAAINAADAQGGGVVYFPPGTYKLGNPLNIAHGIWLVGASKENTKLLANAAILMINGIFTVERPYNAGMAHLTVDGNGIATRCLELDLTSSLYFLDCRFSNTVKGTSAGFAVKLNKVIWTVFEACEFNSSRIGVALSQVGAGIGPPNMTVFRSCRFISNDELGLHVEGIVGTLGVLGITLDGCIFESNGAATGTNPKGAIWAYFVRNLVVTRCYFENNTGDASIHLLANVILPKIVGNFFIEGGAVAPPTNGAVWAETDVQTPIITDNEFGSAGSTNVLISSGAVNAYIARNFVGQTGALTDLGSHNAAANDTTPQVRGADYLVVSNPLATTITNLDEGAPGQRVTLIFGNPANAILKDAATGGSFQLAGGVNFTATPDDTLTVIRHGTTWYEVSRSVN